jgi:hypothetical protein
VVGAHLSVSRARDYLRIVLKRTIERPPVHLYPADEWRIVEAWSSDELVGLTETGFSRGSGFVVVRGCSH